jgi:hypothetical protein
MRRRHDVREFRERIFRRRRLRVENVESGAGQRPGLQRFQQGGAIDEAPPRDIDQNCALLHRSDLRAPEERPSLLRRRRVQRDDVGAAEELRQADERHAHLPRAIGGKKGIVTEEPRLEGARPGRHARAHLAETHDADRLAAKLGAQEFRLLPAAGRHRGGRSRHPAQECQEERECVLDRGHDVGGRSVQNEHAARGRGRDVHVVHPDPGAGDDLEARGRREKLRVDRGRTSDEKGVGLGECAEKLRARHARQVLDVVSPLAQERETRFRDLFGDDDPAHFRKTRS